MRGCCSREFIRDYLSREIDGIVSETNIETIKNYQKHSENSKIRISKNFMRTYSFS